MAQDEARLDIYNIYEQTWKLGREAEGAKVGDPNVLAVGVGESTDGTRSISKSRTVTYGTPRQRKAKMDRQEIGTVKRTESARGGDYVLSVPAQGDEPAAVVEVGYHHDTYDATVAGKFFDPNLKAWAEAVPNSPEARQLARRTLARFNAKHQ